MKNDKIYDKQFESPSLVFDFYFFGTAKYCFVRDNKYYYYYNNK